MKTDQLSDIIFRYCRGELSMEDIDELDLTGEEREYILSQIAEMDEEDAGYEEYEEEEDEDGDDDNNFREDVDGCTNLFLL